MGDSGGGGGGDAGFPGMMIEAGGEEDGAA